MLLANQNHLSKVLNSIIGNINSRLWVIPGVKFMFIWNKAGYYLEQRSKHSGKLMAQNT